MGALPFAVAFLGSAGGAGGADLPAQWISGYMIALIDPEDPPLVLYPPKTMQICKRGVGLHLPVLEVAVAQLVP